VNDRGEIDPDEEESYATYCPECSAQFFEGEEGHGEVYEVPG
jgi:hypothetical protein